jgi:hypothetical protein
VTAIQDSSGRRVSIPMTGSDEKCRASMPLGQIGSIESDRRSENDAKHAIWSLSREQAAGETGDVPKPHRPHKAADDIVGEKAQ